VNRRAFLGALLVIASAASGCAPPPIADQGYELVFRDEFDGDTLSGLWAAPPHGNSLPPELRDGVMTVRATEDNYYFWGVVGSTGPRLATEPSYPFVLSFREGYFEARIRFTDNPWAWPAFWLYSSSTMEAWPNEDCSRLTSEWDIMENGVSNGSGDRPASRWHVSVIHRNTTDGTPEGYCNQPDETRTYSREFPATDLSAWHVWAGRWEGNRLCSYLDDVQLQCMDGFDSTDQPMHLQFSMLYLKSCSVCGPLPPELRLEVDWVRVWQQR
jgi:hypothetical protein